MRRSASLLVNAECKCSVSWMRSWAGNLARSPAPICTKSVKRATMAAGALHQSHFINTEDTDSNHSVGRPMRASALSIEMEAAPTGNNRIETGVTQNNVAPRRELSTASFLQSSSFGYPSALDGTLRRILPQDSNDIVPWCNVALRRVRETRHRHDDFGSIRA